MLTIRKGETSPTAALPAMVLNAQKIEVSVKRKWGLVKIFINFLLITLNYIELKKISCYLSNIILFVYTNLIFGR